MVDVAPGATVTLTATPDDGYRFAGWKVNQGGAVIADDNTFAMPSHGGCGHHQGDGRGAGGRELDRLLAAAGWDTSDHLVRWPHRRGATRPPP